MRRSWMSRGIGATRQCRRYLGRDSKGFFVPANVDPIYARAKTQRVLPRTADPVIAKFCVVLECLLGRKWTCSKLHSPAGEITELYVYRQAES